MHYTKYSYKIEENEEKIRICTQYFQKWALRGLPWHKKSCTIFIKNTDKDTKGYLMNEPYKILIEGGEAECELKKSRFIAHVAVVKSEDEAQAFVASMKKQFYDARHNCYAYVIGKDGETVKYSDDGEPSQTAGLPIYNVLKESGIRNAVIVVTRYFGGTLLGAGPLARMYVEAASLGLSASKSAWMRFGCEAQIVADYANAEKVKRYLEREAVSLIDTRYANDVTLVIRTGFDKYESLCKDIISITGAQASISKIKDAYFVDKSV